MKSLARSHPEEAAVFCLRVRLSLRALGLGGSVVLGII